MDRPLHRVGIDDGGDRIEDGVDVGGRLADRDDRPDPARLRGHRGQIEPLAASTGDQHQRVERPDRCGRGMRRGGLRIVEPLHASRTTEPLEPVRWSRERGERLGDRLARRQPGLQHERRRGQGVGDVVGKPAAHHRDIGDRAARTHQCGAVEVVVGAGGAERAVTPGRPLEMAHHDRVVDEPDRRVGGVLEVEQTRLGSDVTVHRRMPVEMVGRKVQPHRGIGAEPFGPSQTEAGALDHEGVEIVIEGVDQRDVGVAESRCAEARRTQDGNGEFGRRGLAVGPRDRQDRTWPTDPLLLPDVGEFDLAVDRNSAGPGGKDQGMRLGYTGRGREQVELGHEPLEVVR